MKKYTGSQIAIIAFIVLSTISFLVLGFITILNQEDSKLDSSILGVNEINYSGTLRKYPTFSLEKILFPLNRELIVNDASEVNIKTLNIKIISADSKFNILEDGFVFSDGLAFIENTSANKTFTFEIKDKKINLLPSSRGIVDVNRMEIFVVDGIVTSESGQVIEMNQKGKWISDSWSIRNFTFDSIIGQEYFKGLEFTLWNLDYDI